MSNEPLVWTASEIAGCAELGGQITGMLRHCVCDMATTGTGQTTQWSGASLLQKTGRAMYKCTSLRTWAHRVDIVTWTP